MSDAHAADRPPALDYAPGAPARRRRRIRRGVLLGLLLAIGLAGWRLGPGAWRHAQLLYWQRQCLNFNVPKDVVLYERDPDKAAALLKRPDSDYVPLTFYDNHEQSVTNAIYEPRLLREFKALAPVGPGSDPRATLFCHERRTPSGKRRLVIVYTWHGNDDGQFWEWKVYDPAGVFSRSTFLGNGVEVGPEAYRTGEEIPKRICPGQPDPADPARFTFPLLAGGQTVATFEGRLTDDDTILITRRDIPGAP